MSLDTKSAAVAGSLLLFTVVVLAQDRTGARPTTSPSAAPQDDAKSVRDLAGAFSVAFNKGDASAIAAQFVDDGRVFDEDGKPTKGRDAIKERFASAFAAQPGLKVEFRMEELLFPAPGVAIEEGTATATAGTTNPISGRYTVLYVKRDGAWKIAYVRDHADPEADPSDTPHAHLKPLEWMIGEWVDEGDDSVVRTTCAWSDDGNFLIRSFVQHAGGKPMQLGSGTQRIGWDPQREQIRSWVFGSDGSFSEGLWSQLAENQWVVKVSGTTREGDAVTSTNIITREHPDTMRWQSVDRTIGGESLPDAEQIAIARKPPDPATAPATAKPAGNPLKSKGN